MGARDLASYPDVLTIEEARHVLRVSRGVAYEQVRQGAIPSIRVGRAIRIPRVALARLLDGSDDRARGEDGAA